jgi:hypothetical protein
MSDTSLVDSLKSLVSPKTIPFLISQGVVPKLLPVVTATIGLALGFIWAYLISPTVFVGGTPVNLSDSWQQEYIKQVAWQYAAYAPTNLQGAADNAKRQLAAMGDAGDEFAKLNANNTDAQLALQLQQIKDFAVNNPDVQRDVQPGLLNGALTPILCVLGILIIPGLAVIVNTIIPITLLFQPRSKEASTTSGTEAERRRQQEESARKLKELEKAAPAPTINRGAPVGQYMSAYIIGDDLYDDSFAIETASDEFLGETGAGISKTIGVGDPKKVTAIEVWVFDKTDIKTLTKVLMSEHAYNDEALRAELAPKGEPFLVSPGAIIMLETTALTVQARVVDVAYGSGSLPTNSFYDRITVEIQAWPKKPGESTAGAGDAGGAVAAPVSTPASTPAGNAAQFGSGGSPDINQLTPPPPPPTLPGAGNMFDTGPMPPRQANPPQPPPANDAFGDTGIYKP